MNFEVNQDDRPATKVTQILPRPNGAEVKIVAETMFGAGLTPSVDITVFKRARPDEAWHLCGDRPADNWRRMPREEYLKHGRSEALQTVTTAEILKVASMLGKPMSQFASSAQA